MSNNDALGCLLSLRAHVALDGVSWSCSGLVEIPSRPARYRVLKHRRRHPRPPLGVAPLGSSFRFPVSFVDAPLCEPEYGAVPDHPMHNDSQPPGECDPRLARCGAFGNRQSPILQFQCASIACQHDIRRLIEEVRIRRSPNWRCCPCSRPRPTGAAWHEAELGTQIAGAPEATGVIDDGGEGEPGEMAGAGDRHQPRHTVEALGIFLMSASIAATAWSFGSPATSGPDTPAGFRCRRPADRRPPAHDRASAPCGRSRIRCADRGRLCQRGGDRLRRRCRLPLVND